MLYKSIGDGSIDAATIAVSTMLLSVPKRIITCFGCPSSPTSPSTYHLEYSTVSMILAYSLWSFRTALTEARTFRGLSLTCIAGQYVRRSLAFAQYEVAADTRQSSTSLCLKISGHIQYRCLLLELRRNS
jgi:hypothetical protein